MRNNNEETKEGCGVVEVRGTSPSGGLCSLKTDGIIFDVDGTIWDSTPVVEKAWNKAFEDTGHLGVRVSADTLKGLFGLPMLDIIEAIIPSFTLEERKAFLPVCSGYEFDYLEKESGIVYEGLEKTLSTLVNKGIPLFIVSNCQSGYIELLFTKTGLGKYFKDHLCPGDTGKYKADNILIISDRYGLKAPVYVGDTVMDHEACKNAKTRMIFAAYGFGDVTGADAVIYKPEDLLERVEIYES